MRIYDNRQPPSKDFLCSNRVYFRPETAVEAVQIIRHLNDKMGLPFVTDDDGRLTPRYISCACREGILVDEGKIHMGSGDVKCHESMYVMTAAQLIPGYETPMAALFNEMAKRLAALEERLAEVEENTDEKGVVRKVGIIDGDGPR